MLLHIEKPGHGLMGGNGEKSLEKQMTVPVPAGVIQVEQKETRSPMVRLAEV